MNSYWLSDRQTLKRFGEMQRAAQYRYRTASVACLSRADGLDKHVKPGFALYPGNNYIVLRDLTFSQNFYPLLSALTQQVDQVIIYAARRGFYPAFCNVHTGGGGGGGPQKTQKHTKHRNVS
jgi:hypothetical protein